MKTKSRKIKLAKVSTKRKMPKRKRVMPPRRVRFRVVEGKTSIQVGNEYKVVNLRSRVAESVSKQFKYQLVTDVITVDLNLIHKSLVKLGFKVKFKPDNTTSNYLLRTGLYSIEIIPYPNEGGVVLNIGTDIPYDRGRHERFSHTVDCILDVIGINEDSLEIINLLEGEINYE